MSLWNRRHRLDSQQELLLRAALTEGSGATAAWESWKAAAPHWNQWEAGIELERLDPDSYRLLPLLYHNLARHGVENPLMVKLKGVYRHTWSSNKLLIHKTAPVLQSFLEASISVMVLKGAAIVNDYYGDYGLRPMDDIDLMVHPSDVPAALSLLRRAGWKVPEMGCVARVISEVHCTDPSGRTLDLHWHLFPNCTQWTDAKAEAPFWQDAVKTQLGDCTVYALNPTDQFFHLCLHGSSWGVTQPFRWVADACTILRKAPGEIVWNRLLKEGQRWQMVSRLYGALSLLRDQFGFAIPEWILDDLRKSPTTAPDRIECLINLRRSQGALELLVFLYCQYKRYGPPMGVFGFPRYLGYMWGVESLRQVPAAAALRIRRRLSARRIVARDNKRRAAPSEVGPGS